MSIDYESATTLLYSVMTIERAKLLAPSLVFRILAMKFTGEFMLIYALMTIMFGEYGHVSAAGIGVILAAGFVLSVVFELPTGVIADRISRKYVIIAAIIYKALGLTMWLVWPAFWGYMVAAVLFAFGEALESGALQAYLYGQWARGPSKASPSSGRASKP